MLGSVERGTRNGRGISPNFVYEGHVCPALAKTLTASSSRSCVSLLGKRTRKAISDSLSDTGSSSFKSSPVKYILDRYELRICVIYRETPPRHSIPLHPRSRQWLRYQGSSVPIR